MAQLSFDRAKAGLSNFIQGFLVRLDFYALYPAVVTAQNAPANSSVSGTLELIPDDKRLPGLSAVPLRSGIPGVQVTVAAGVRVLVGFENGKPSGQYAALWSFDAGMVSLVVNGSSSLSLVAPAVNLGQNPGAAGVGRLGDQVQVTLTPAQIATIVAPPGAGGGPCTGGPITLIGTITAASTVVKAS